MPDEGEVSVGRLVVVIDLDTGVSPAGLVEVWNADGMAVALGVARVESAVAEAFLPGVAEWVVIPLAVSLASTVLYDVVRRLVGRAQPTHGVSEVELTEHTSQLRDRVVVVRSRVERSRGVPS